MKFRKRPVSPVVGVPHESEVSRPQRADDVDLVAAGVLDERHREQRARVVVQAVAVLVARHRERRVLEQAGVVGHRPQVPEARLGQVHRARGEGAGVERGAHPVPVGLAGALEARQVARGDRGPRHVAAVLGPARAHRAAPRVVAQKLGDRAGDGRRIAPGHEHAPPVGQQLAGVEVRRRDHGLARAERVGQRARGDLLLLEVRRDVDVGRREELGELAVAHEPVVEDDAALDAELERAALEHESGRSRRRAA